VLSIPLIFISTTISQVFFQQTTEKKHQQSSIKNDVKNIFYLLLVIIVVELIVIELLGPQLFGFVFGERYTISGDFSKILIFSFTLNFIGSTFSSIFITFDKIRLNSIWQITYFCIICSLLLFKGLSIDNFLKIYVGIEVLMHSIYCVLIYLIVNHYEKTIKKQIL
jgi:O-antigen/teichoic acid export membrane protein